MRKVIMLAAALLLSLAARAQVFDIALDGGAKMRVQACSGDIFRVQITNGGEYPESLLMRYGILRTDWPDAGAKLTEDASKAQISTSAYTLTVDKKAGTVSVDDALGGTVIRKVEYLTADEPLLGALAQQYNERYAPLHEEVRVIGSDHNERYVKGNCDIPDPTRVSALRFSIGDSTRIYGGGSVSRSHLQHRGEVLRIFTTYANTENVTPFVSTTEGWGVLNNTTYLNYFDCCVAQSDKLIAYNTAPGADFYLMMGDGLLALLQRYHSIAGNNYLLPRWAYGCSYGPHMNSDAFVFMDEAVRFMDGGYPMDMMWVEPQWMETYYDWTTAKKWDFKKFPGEPYWYFDNPTTIEHPGSYLYRMHQMGYKNALWLNIDTDLSLIEEDRLAAGQGKPLSGEGNWFDHLRHFMRNGVDGFKLDPGQTIDRHPYREYYNGRSDDEMHSVNQVLLPKQFLAMSRDERPQRSFHHYCGGYVGTQHFSAATTGDNGGGMNVLYDQLNLQMSGYINTSCDVAVSPECLHMGSFIPWMQINSWYSFKEPWYAAKSEQVIYRNYLQLRNRMVPYTYSAALKGTLDSEPIMRPMPMAFPDDRNCDDMTTEYMYGDAFLVGAFTDKVYLPEGVWYDFWTNGRIDSKGETLKAEYDKTQYGGQLFVRIGAIVPFQRVAPHANANPLDTIVLNIWPARSGEYTFYEDDGDTYAHEQGAIARTRFSYVQEGGRLKIAVDPVQGSYEGMYASRVYEMKVTLARKPRSVKVAGKKVKDFTYDGRGVLTFTAEHPDTAQSLEMEIRL